MVRSEEFPKPENKETESAPETSFDMNAAMHATAFLLSTYEKAVFTAGTSSEKSGKKKQLAKIKGIREALRSLDGEDCGTNAWEFLGKDLCYERTANNSLDTWFGECFFSR